VIRGVNGGDQRLEVNVNHARRRYCEDADLRPESLGNVWHFTVSRPKPAKPESLQST
jgi:hypothetical protein